MGHQVIRVVLALCLCLFVFPAQATRAVFDNLFVEDSDGLWQYRALIGMDEEINRPLVGSSAGFRVGRWRISDDAGTEDFDMLRLHFDSGDVRPWRTRLGVAHLSGEGSPTLGDASLSWKGGPWYVEAGAQRELIDTVTAVRLHTLVDTLSLSADYRFNARWTAVGALYSQWLTDDNRRNGGVARLIYSVAAIDGLTIQGRLRRVDSDFNGVGYFSPDRLQESLLLVGYRRALGEHWVFGAQLGGGRQEIDRDSSNDLYYGELGLRGWFTDQYGLDSRLACSSAGGNALGQGDADYRYCSANVSLILAW